MPRLSKKRNIRSKRKSYKKRKVGGRYKKRVRSYSKKKGGAQTPGRYVTNVGKKTDHGSAKSTGSSASTGYPSGTKTGSWPQMY
mgnify:CR=1 FL=1